MLRIRQSQYKIFEDATFQRFQEQMIHHIVEHFPHHADYLGHDGIFQVIKCACAQGEAHGFNTERELTLFTDLSIILGVGFDSDPQLSWAKTYLDDKTITGKTRIDGLWDNAISYLDRLLGPENLFPTEPFLIMQGIQRNNVFVASIYDQPETIGKYLRTIWPEKSAYIGEPAVNALLKYTRQLAHHYRLPIAQGYCELTLHAFLFGHHFITDPVYPWASQILNAELGGKARIEKITYEFSKRFK